MDVHIGRALLIVLCVSRSSARHRGIRSWRRLPHRRRAVRAGSFLIAAACLLLLAKRSPLRCRRASSTYSTGRSPPVQTQRVSPGPRLSHPRQGQQRGGGTRLLIAAHAPRKVRWESARQQVRRVGDSTAAVARHLVETQTSAQAHPGQPIGRAARRGEVGALTQRSGGEPCARCAAAGPPCYRAQRSSPGERSESAGSPGAARRCVRGGKAAAAAFSFI